MKKEGASLEAQMVKNLLAEQESWLQSLCWEDPLEKERATYSSILTWRIPWTEAPGGLPPIKSGTLLKQVSIRKKDMNPIGHVGDAYIPTQGSKQILSDFTL